MPMKKRRKIWRTHKDRLFHRLFSEKENALSLYNALNGTNYGMEDGLKIVTLEDAIYLTMKNDVAVCLCDSINLWEQQSSVNPNMPLRGLMYFSKEYEGWLSANQKYIYGEKLIKIPAPKFYVLYNGEEQMPEREEYRLTDAFEHPSPGYEWTAYMVNINSGNNPQLMKRCKVLNDYTEFITQIRERQKAGETIEEAVNEAMKYCIENDCLKTYLLKNRGEVMSMILTEYDEKMYKKTLLEEGIERGIGIGKAQGIELGKKQTVALANTIFKLYKAGGSYEEIARSLGVSIEQIRELLD